jgi:DNA-directed RNA polymerase subunit RPC12/RpoP
MALERPKSMNELAYFTKRKLGENGKADVWVFKQKCSCGGIPKKVSLRGKEYVCPDCSKRFDKKEYEDQLVASVAYTCPGCGKFSEVQVPYARKKVTLIKDNGKKKRVDALVFKCDSCDYEFKITKKMK